MSARPTFFRTPSDFRAWLAEHHATAKELWVGYHKKHTGERSITWPESVDEALCYGWIDGIRKSIDDSTYKIRFTPRRSGSTWSSVNVRRVQALIERGQMQPAGLDAFRFRKEQKSGIHSYEQRSPELQAPYDSMLKRNQAAWDFLQRQPPSYRKAVSWWIISAKREETRLKRLEKLIACSAQGKTIPEWLPGRSARRSRIAHRGS
jgi:uncharacterized protein YdeI (YjbR/CyaY-like superfamily)